MNDKKRFEVTMNTASANAWILDTTTDTAVSARSQDLEGLNHMCHELNEDRAKTFSVGVYLSHRWNRHVIVCAYSWDDAAQRAVRMMERTHNTVVVNSIKLRK